jgi:hypothetical protein
MCPLSELLDLDAISKFHTLRNRQDGWCRQHQAKITTDFSDVDHVDRESKKSLREMILTLPATTGHKSTPLFNAIDKSWRGNGYNISFHPDKAAEASVVLKSLLVRLQAMYGDGVRKLFSPEAVKRA